jgi:hypothetical protein
MPGKKLRAEDLSSASDAVLNLALGRERSPALPVTAPRRPLTGFDFREAREEMIRIAAYFIAEKRGFLAGAELDDWLAAEAEIDARLNE